MAPPDSDHSSIRAVIGQNVARIRDEKGLTAEALADEMRIAGFSWAAQRVYELEAGRKQVSIGELLALAAAASRQGDPVTLPELLRSTELVPVSEVMGLMPEAMEDALTGGEVVFSLTATAQQKFDSVANKASSIANAASQELRTWGLQGIDMDTMRAARDPDSADRKAAARLDVPVWVVQMTAHRLWGRRLSAERDAEVDPEATAQARGHVTRTLTEQLREEIERTRGDD
ncbi:hypothetical protein ACFWQJ_02835 [Kocuria palustris]|uniref:hypothetical protein n=1 Tax=Kocuria palustris TaxID=71999 RepID=UPI00366027EF